MHWPHFGKRRWEKRMEAEMRFHVESQVAEYILRGIAPAEAEARARGKPDSEGTLMARPVSAIRKMLTEKLSK